MTDQPSTPSEPEQPATPDAPAADAAEPETAAPAGPVIEAGEMEEGKTFAILCYALSLISIPFFLVPLIMRNNTFALYHAKQSLMLWLAGVAVSVVGGVSMAVCVGFVILPVGMIALLVFDVIGLMNAVKGEAKPLPLIGKWADDWFKGIKKA